MQFFKIRIYNLLPKFCDVTYSNLSLYKIWYLKKKQKNNLTINN